ncbi:hypothetical protein KHO57_gp046 [Mycobacterium phage Phabba]|uniref:Uncharacterized protein n=1 Tax=Mycobacterium phage Phabba TaxID=2027899 RepID=A0A249XSB3_9CAUD|nr:hypothetical protein KHO57_gp046 [Mycobacterium phage Phabba]ASZ74621.1 hypothetical protein SEA_PHABBA_46 [Mycobacterium phage Phabba]
MSHLEMFLRLIGYIGGAIIVVGGIAMAYAWLTTPREADLCPGGCGDPEWDCLNKRAMCPPLQKR